MRETLRGLKEAFGDVVDVLVFFAIIVAILLMTVGCATTRENAAEAYGRGFTDGSMNQSKICDGLKRAYEQSERRALERCEKCVDCVEESEKSKLRKALREAAEGK